MSFILETKQDVRVVLAMFDPSSIAAIKHYFRNNADSAEFLDLVKTWWVTSNSKRIFNSCNKLGNTAVRGDGKPQNLRSFASWIKNWKNQHISNAQKLTLTAQSNDALVRTLQCHTVLIDDSLSNGQEFVLTTRFQSDPIERRFG